MSVSIISCPSCKSLVLSDTVQCPTCQHLLKEELKDAVPAELPAIVRASEDEVPCPDCGEMVRTGLVRCWRCGGFLREDIAERYQEMLDSPQDVIYSSSSAGGRAVDAPESGMPVSDGNDDFELADGVGLMSQADLALQRKKREKAGQSPAGESQDEGETYGLNAAATERPADTEEPASDTGSVGSEESGTDGAAAESVSDKESAEEKPAGEVDSSADALLDIANQEQAEAAARRKERARSRARGEKIALPGFLFVFCPNGHQIQVEDKYRGMTGRCPRCKSFFHVPQLNWEQEKQQAKQAEEESRKESRYKTWTVNAHLHQLDPTKLKLKPGSLEKDFQDVDLGFAEEGMLIVTHGKQNAGLFNGEKNRKKLDELRAEVQEYLRLDKELLDLPAAGFRNYNCEDMANITVVQPAAMPHESMIAGVPVFGEGRIALRMPVTDQDKDVKDILFVSFWLSEFREFGERIKELYGIEDLGRMEGVSLEDSRSNYKCHYSDRPIESLEATVYHEKDPGIELEIVGRKCQACSLVVGEDSRKKEKLGGSAGKGIAKAQCPKCKQKFGDTTLWGLKAAEDSDNSLAESGGVAS